MRCRSQRPETRSQKTSSTNPKLLPLVVGKPEEDPDQRHRWLLIPDFCLPASRKEVIQPQVPLRLPCYDFTPVADLTVAGCPLAVGTPSSGKTNSHGVTGGVYKARERIHRGMLIRDY